MSDHLDNWGRPKDGQPSPPTDIAAINNKINPEQAAITRRANEVRNQRLYGDNDWDALGDLTEEKASIEAPKKETTMAKKIDTKQLKQEIKDIILHKDKALSISEFRDVFDLEGINVESTHLNNTLNSMVKSKELIKVEAPDLMPKAKYRFDVLGRAPETNQEINGQATRHSNPAKTAETPANTANEADMSQDIETPETQDAVAESRPDQKKAEQVCLGEFEERYGIFIELPDSVICRVASDIEEAKEMAKSIAVEYGDTINIHRIFSAPAVECVPVTTCEFKEVANGC